MIKEPILMNARFCKWVWIKLECKTEAFDPNQRVNELLFLCDYFNGCIKPRNFLPLTHNPVQEFKELLWENNALGNINEQARKGKVRSVAHHARNTRIRPRGGLTE